MIGILYVENTFDLLVSEISNMLVGKHLQCEIKKESTKGNLTYQALEIERKLSKAKSLIVIVDEGYWATLWKDSLNKIQNKLEELILDEKASLEFIIVVGINTNQIENFDKYLSCETIWDKVRRMPVSSKDITSELVEIVAKQVVDIINQKAHDDVHNSSVSPETDFNVPSTSRNDKDTEEDDYYTLQRPGLCFYVGVLEYSIESKLPKRHASAAELKKIQNSFEKLGCVVKQTRNPTKHLAETFLNEGIKWCEKLKPSFVVLVISAHGQEAPSEERENPLSKNSFMNRDSRKETLTEEIAHQLFMHDGEPLLTKEIIKKFQNCTSLSNKPCLFFIQACRSHIRKNESVDRGVTVPSGSRNGKSTKEGQLTPNHSKDNTDANPSNQEDSKSKANYATENAIGELSNQMNACNVLQTAPQENLYSKAVEVFPTPCSNDGLVMFASPPGKYAYNRDSEGGWLITNLEAQIQETLDQNLEKIDLLDELIKVTGRIAQEYETTTQNPEDSGHKSVPCIYHKLSKDIIIWPEKMKKAKDLVEQNDPEWQEFLKWNP